MGELLKALDDSHAVQFDGTSVQMHYGTTSKSTAAARPVPHTNPALLNMHVFPSWRDGNMLWQDHVQMPEPIGKRLHM